MEVIVVVVVKVRSGGYVVLVVKERWSWFR